MSTENKISLVHIDIGGLSEIGKSVIDHLAKFIGGIAEPHQIKRIANAQSDAALIRATSEIHIQGLQQRAATRTIQEQARHQYNMESIALEAAKEVNSQGTRPNEDWLEHFFQHARHISSTETQQLWSKILANEFEQPGQVSKKLLDILRSLDLPDAELFQKLCGHSVVVDGEPRPLFPASGHLHKLHEESGITVSRIKDLEAVGLVNLVTFKMGGELPPKSGKYHFKMGSYIIEAHIPESPKPKAGVSLGLTSFTKYGKELFHIINIEPSNEFKRHLKDQILRAGYSMLEPSNYPTTL